MGKKSNLSSWMEENVPDNSEWGEYYLIIRKEETRTGARVQISQTIQPPKDAYITGKEIKDYLNSETSPFLGAILIVAGVLIFVILHLLKEPMDSIVYRIVSFVLPASVIAYGIYRVIKSQKLLTETRAISSWEKLEPHIESALSEKVYREEVKKREAELETKGSAYAGYFCIPARLPASGQFEQPNSKGALMDHLKPTLLKMAADLPAEGLWLRRRK